MQEGSLLIMVKPLEKSSKDWLVRFGINRWPVPDPNEIHMVTAMHDVTKITTQFETGIQIDTFPEIAAAGLWLNPDYFREIESPTVNLEQLMEPKKEEKPNKVAVPV